MLDEHGAFAFFGNPKCAGVSMGTAFGDRIIVSHRGRMRWRRVWREHYADRLDDVFLFTFVRNPWDKVVSAFHFLQQRGKIANHWEFSSYVKRVLAIQGTEVNMHFRPQAPSFMFRGRVIGKMFIGRFEFLQLDWRAVCDRLNLKVDLPHMNRSRHEHYMRYYDPESRDLVRWLYREEIEALGYEFGQ